MTTILSAKRALGGLSTLVAMDRKTSKPLYRQIYGPIELILSGAQTPPTWPLSRQGCRALKWDLPRALPKQRTSRRSEDNELRIPLRQGARLWEALRPTLGRLFESPLRQ
jgi:hypothetical protein